MRKSNFARVTAGRAATRGNIAALGMSGMRLNAPRDGA